MKTLKRNQTKLLLWSANVQYQSAVIYENTFFVLCSPFIPFLRLALMIISSRKMSFMSSDGREGKKKKANDFHSSHSVRVHISSGWESKVFRQMDLGRAPQDGSEEGESIYTQILTR